MLTAPLYISMHRIGQLILLVDLIVSFFQESMLQLQRFQLLNHCISKGDTVPLNYNFIFNARSCVVPSVYYSDSRHVFACNTFKSLFVMNMLHGIHACKVKVHACTILTSAWGQICTRSLSMQTRME